MTVAVPESLRWWSATPDGAAWLDRLPRLVEECAADWRLELAREAQSLRTAVRGVIVARESL